jgi:hypothetical protein
MCLPARLTRAPSVRQVTYRRADYSRGIDGRPRDLDALRVRWRNALKGCGGTVNVCDRMSVSEVEVDALAADVLNKDDVEMLPLTVDNRDTHRVVQSLRYIWQDLRERSKAYGMDTPEKANLTGMSRFPLPLP